MSKKVDHFQSKCCICFNHINITIPLQIVVIAKSSNIILPEEESEIKCLKKDCQSYKSKLSKVNTKTFLGTANVLFVEDSNENNHLHTDRVESNNNIGKVYLF